MILCSCEAVSDRTIDRVIAEGCTTVAAIGRACGAGTGCGGCVPELRRRLAPRSATEGAVAFLRAALRPGALPGMDACPKQG